MTAVFEYREDTDRFASLFPVSDRTTERLMELVEERVTNWTPPQLHWTGPVERGDFAYLLSHFPVVSERALNVLRPLLGPKVDVLDVEVPDGGYYGLHIRDMPHCLDTEASEIVWLAPGRALDIERYVFRAEAVKGHHLFRLPEMSTGIAFLSDTAMDAIDAAGLIGLMHVKLWEE